MRREEANSWLVSPCVGHSTSSDVLWRGALLSKEQAHWPFCTAALLHRPSCTPPALAILHWLSCTDYPALLHSYTGYPALAFLHSCTGHPALTTLDILLSSTGHPALLHSRFCTPALTTCLLLDSPVQDFSPVESPVRLFVSIVI